MDENRGHIYVKEVLSIGDENDESNRTVDQEPEQGIFLYRFYFIKEFFIFISSYERTF